MVLDPSPTAAHRPIPIGALKLARKMVQICKILLRIISIYFLTPRRMVKRRRSNDLYRATRDIARLQRRFASLYDFFARIACVFVGLIGRIPR